MKTKTIPFDPEKAKNLPPGAVVRMRNGQVVRNLVITDSSIRAFVGGGHFGWDISGECPLLGDEYTLVSIELPEPDAPEIDWKQMAQSFHDWQMNIELKTGHPPNHHAVTNWFKQQVEEQLKNKGQ